MSPAEECETNAFNFGFLTCFILHFRSWKDRRFSNR